VTRRRERRSKQLLDELHEAIGYWKLKEEELDCSVWRTGLGRSYGPVVKKLPDDDDNDDDDGGGGKVIRSIGMWAYCGQIIHRFL